jgi:uncharacterized protein (TIGR02118 family)
MTVKLVVLYMQPDDPEAFDEHYLGVHMPMVAGVPGLERAESGRIFAAADGGEKTYYRIAELYFADQEALNAGLGSAQGKAVAADYTKIAPPGSRLFVATVDG